MAPTTILVLKRAPELILAAFGPKANDGAREDQAEDESRGGDEAGDREQAP